MSCELTFFKEKEQVIELFSSISINNDSWNENLEAKLDLINEVLSKYQEQPLLLNPYLVPLTEPLTNRMIAILQSFAHGSFGNINELIPQMNVLCKIFQIVCRVRGYKHVMKQLPHNVEYLEPCYYLLKNESNLEWETKYVLLLWLRMLCLIPFDICSIDSSVTMNTTTDMSTVITSNNFEGKLVNNIVNYCAMTLGESGPTREAAAVCLSTLLTRPDMEKAVLSDFLGKSVVELKQWLTRGNDAQQEVSKKYFQIVGILQCISHIFKIGHRDKLLPHTESLLGIVLLIAKQPNQLLIRKLVTKVIQRIGMVFLPPRLSSWRYNRGKRSLALNMSNSSDTTSDINALDTNVAVEQDIDEEEVEIPEEIDDIMEYLLSSLGDKDTIVRWSAGKGVGRMTTRLSKQLADDVLGALIQQFDEDIENDCMWHGCCLALAELARRGTLLPVRLEEVVPLIIRAMNFDVVRGYHSVGSHVRDAACYACWAFARAYSPELLRKYMLDDESSSETSLSSAMLLTSLFDREVNCRRAASAAFQENVGRQGHVNFPFGLDIIRIADYFSLGNRKAAFTTIASEIAQLQFYRLENGLVESHSKVLQRMWKYLVSYKIYHWDVEIRKIASLALANLIECLPACEVDAQIHPSMLDIYNMILDDLNSIILPNCLDISNVNIRHGSILSIGHILFAINKFHPQVFFQSKELLELIVSEKEFADYTWASKGFGMKLLPRIVTIFPDLDRLRLFRGKGSEMMRTCACELIQQICLSDVNIQLLVSFNSNQAKKLQLSILELLLENIKQPHENVQVAARFAIQLFCQKFYYSSKNVTVKEYERVKDIAIIKILDSLESSFSGQHLKKSIPPAVTMLRGSRYSEQYDSSSTPQNAAVIRGYALLLGCYSRYLVTTGNLSDMSLLERIFKACIMLCDRSYRINGDTDMETRRNAFTSLVDICLQWIDKSDIIAMGWSTLMSGCNDYTTDNRGDTGSWIRQIALQGAERLLYENYIFTHIKEFPNVQQSCFGIVEILPHQQANNFCEFRHPLQLPCNYANKVYPRTLAQSIEYVNTITSSYDSMVQDLILQCLRQMGEKLDNIRETAGVILERLVRSSIFSKSVISFSFLLQHLPPRQEIPQLVVSKEEGVEVEEVEESTYPILLHWSQASITFPFLTKVMNSPCGSYLGTIIRGLVISIGGLSDSLSKLSFQSFIDYHKNINGNDSNQAKFVQVLGSLFNSAVSLRDDRLLSALLKTVGSMFEYDLIKVSQIPEHYEVALDIQRILLQELNSCVNIHKIQSCIYILIIMLATHGTLRKISYFALLNLLGHKFPKIRKFIAEALYLQLVSDSNVMKPKVSEVLEEETSEDFQIYYLVSCDEHYQQLEQKLLTLQWENLSVSVARSHRDELCNMLEVDLNVIRELSSNSNSFPERSIDSKKSIESDAKNDELDSYSSLVRDAGY